MIREPSVTVARLTAADRPGALRPPASLVIGVACAAIMARITWARQARAAMHLALAVLMAPLLLAACDSDPIDTTDPDPTTLPERVQLASVQQAREVLGHTDAWAVQLSVFDRGVRQRTLEPTTTEAFLEFASSAAVDWTPSEQGYWSGIVDRLGDAVEGLDLHIPNILLVKTTGEEEFNAAYTRDQSIFIPQQLASAAGDQRFHFFLLAHELFHVLSRSEENRAQRDALYTLLDFERFEDFEYPAELEERRLSNPDAYFADFALTVETASASAEVVAVLHSAVPLEEVVELSSTEGPAAIFDVLDIVLLPVDTGTGRVLRDDSGDPIRYGFDNTDWVTQMQRNSSYIIHPEELLADNFATLMEWRADGVLPSENPTSGFPINDADLLEAMEDALEADSDG